MCASAKYGMVKLMANVLFIEVVKPCFAHELNILNRLPEGETKLVTYLYGCPARWAYMALGLSLIVSYGGKGSPFMFAVDCTVCCMTQNCVELYC